MEKVVLEVRVLFPKYFRTAFSGEQQYFFPVDYCIDDTVKIGLSASSVEHPGC